MSNLIFCMGNPIFCIYVKIEIGEFKYSDDDDPICPTKKLAGFFLAFNNRSSTLNCLYVDIGHHFTFMWIYIGTSAKRVLNSWPAIHVTCN